MCEFQNKVCMITGGANGIGKSIGREFAKEGAQVAFMDTNAKAGAETRLGF